MRPIESALPDRAINHQPSIVCRGSPKSVQDSLHSCCSIFDYFNKSWFQDLSRDWEDYGSTNGCNRRYQLATGRSTDYTGALGDCRPVDRVYFGVSGWRPVTCPLSLALGLWAELIGCPSPQLLLFLRARDQVPCPPRERHDAWSINNEKFPKQEPASIGSCFFVGIWRLESMPPITDRQPPDQTQQPGSRTLIFGRN